MLTFMTATGLEPRTTQFLNEQMVECSFKNQVVLVSSPVAVTKGYMLSWSEEIFVIKKIKNTVPWTYVINHLNGEEIIGTFYEKELQGTNQQEFKIEKVIKKKGDKLYVKWKGYNSSFNSWIGKKDIV